MPMDAHHGARTSTVEDAIARLRARFLSEYRGQHADLLAFYDTLRAGTGTDETVAGALNILHRIGGTSGTLGLARLSAAAQSAERGLRDLPPGAAKDLPVQVLLYDFLLVSAEVANQDAQVGRRDSAS